MKKIFDFNAWNNRERKKYETGNSASAASGTFIKVLSKILIGISIIFSALLPILIVLSMAANSVAEERKQYNNFELMSISSNTSIRKDNAKKRVGDHHIGVNKFGTIQSGSVTTISFKLEGVTELPEDWEVSPKGYVKEACRWEDEGDLVIVYNVTGLLPEYVRAESKSLDVYF